MGAYGFMIDSLDFVILKMYYTIKITFQNNIDGREMVYSVDHKIFFPVSYTILCCIFRVMLICAVMMPQMTE